MWIAIYLLNSCKEANSCREANSVAELQKVSAAVFVVEH